MKILKWLWLPVVLALIAVIIRIGYDSNMRFALQLYTILNRGVLYLDLDENAFIRLGLETVTDSKNRLGVAEELARVYRDTADTNIWENKVLPSYQKAIDVEPDNRPAYAGMVISLVGRFLPRYNYPVEKILAGIDRAEKMDPDNALYNYCRAYIYLDQGGDFNKTTNELYSEEFKILRDVSDINIKDIALMEKGLQEVAAGNRKSYYSTYQTERVKAVLDLMKSQGRLDIRSKVSAGFERPFLLGQFRFISRSLTALSRYYEKAPDPAKAQSALELTIPLGPMMAGKSRMVVEMLVALSIMETSATSLKHFYYTKGDQGQVAYYDRKLAELSRLKETIRTMPEGWREKMGLLDALLIPGSGVLENYDMGIGRRLDYSLMENILLVIMFGVMIILIVIILIGWFYSARRLKKYQLPDIEINWRMKDLALIYLGGLILPLFFYILYDLTHFARDYGIFLLRDTIFTQMACILILCLCLILVITGRRLRQKLDGPAGLVHSNAIALKRYSFLVAIGLVAFMVYFWTTTWCGVNGGYLLFASGIALILTVAGWISSLRQAKKQGGMGLVYQRRVLYFKSLIPILGWGLVILILLQFTITKPYFEKSLKAYETAYVDRAIEDEVGMTNWKALRDLAQKEIGNK